MRRTRRTLDAASVSRLLEALGVARTACVKFITSAPIHDPHYSAACEVMETIDGYAEVATGDRTHFHGAVHSLALGPPKPG